MPNGRELIVRVLVVGTTVAALAACRQDSAPLAPAETHPSFEGIWSGFFTTRDHEFWRLEDIACFAGCTKAAYEFMGTLLDDPANDEKPFDALMGQTFQFMYDEMTRKLTPEGVEMQKAVTPNNDPTLDCKPYGFFREAINPLPMVIARDGDSLRIRYEEWDRERTIHMDGRGHPQSATLTEMGHSIGRYEGDALVVDTVAIQGDIFYSFITSGGYADGAHATERYTIQDNPRRMNVEITIEDPVMLREPYTVSKTWLYTPDAELVADSCEDYPTRP